MKWQETKRAAEIARLPEWARRLSTRLRNALWYAYVRKDIPDMSQDAVRNAGEVYWTNIPNIGRLSVAALAVAIGGWPADRGDIGRKMERRRARIAAQQAEGELSC